MPQVLTAVETTDLHDAECVIKKGLGTFIEVGQSLQRIRDGRLYRESHSTFKEYCRGRWGITKAYAHRQIQAARIAPGFDRENLLKQLRTGRRELGQLIRRIEAGRLES